MPAREASSPPRLDGIREAFRGRHLRVDVERWSDLGDYEIARREPGAGAVGIVALTPAEEVLLVRQFRHPVRAPLLEIPAGLRDVPDEPPEECAERELFEETGFRASGPVRHLGDFYSSAGMTDERFLLYFARTAPWPEGDPEAGIEVVRMSFAEALAACRDARIHDSKTALGLLLAAGWLPARPSRRARFLG